ncbi:MAG: MBOAT family O-acyltransferase [Evtepia sp.]
MLFSSIAFLYFFFLVVLALWRISPPKFRNLILLLASLFFYAFGQPTYVLLLLFSSVSNWLFSLVIENNRGTPRAKHALVSAIVLSLALLLFFKYTDFFLQTINQIFGLAIPLTEIPLPIGISFFTFQTMSYTIDVYRGDVHAQRNIITFSTFVCLFPQLIAGPVVRYSEIETELVPHRNSLSDFSYGIRRFTIGLAKKVLIANALDELCTLFRGSGEASVLFLWIYAISFTLQIYFDFSGYSDMAIGLGRMFGFHFPENFNFPYISRSVTEFWRRWHMTLGGWFRDYVYIPLGGNRNPQRWKWFRNIAIVWLLTGLWHGAAWNFVLWGGMYGVLLMSERLWLKDFLARHRIFSHLYVLFFATVGFVIFNADSSAILLSDLSGLFGFAGLPLSSFETIYYLKSFAPLLLLAIIGATPLPKMLCTRFEHHPIMTVLEPLTLALLLIVITASLVDGSFNPFLYFRF